MAAIYRALRVGPALEDPDLGPLISARQKARVEGFLAGAGDLETVARTPLGPLPDDHYLAPTLLRGSDPAHPIAQEEVFGPVQLVMPFGDEDEAAALADGTPFGLVAGIWTRDGARQMRLARRLRAGQVFVNTYGAGGGVELPFGGTGRSGHGREKGFEALMGFSRLKTVAMHHG